MPSTEAGERSANHRILLVDDQHDITEVLRQGLELYGFQVDAFSSPQQALKAFKPKAYDLAVLDIRMPGLSGIQLYREIKRIDPAVIACFLSAFEIYPDEFKKVFPSMVEVKTIIKKPVTIDSLVKKIMPLLRVSEIANAVSGDHILALFETPKDLIEQTMQFLKVGLLENEEDILLVTDQLPKEIIREKIATEWGVDVDSLEAEGMITLMTFTEWHLTDGKFDQKRSKVRFAKMVQQSLGRGRKGFRSVEDMDPFLRLGMTQELAFWESALGKKFDMPVTVMCAYTKDSIHQLDGAAIVVLEKSHSRVIK